MENQNKYTFEEFQAVKGKFSPSISLTKSGGFGLSSGLYHRYNLDRYMGVKLYFDKGNKVVGLKFLEQEEPGMFSLKHRKKDKGGFFMAKSFLGAYAVDTEKYCRKYQPEIIEQEGIGRLFIIHLKARE